MGQQRESVVSGMEELIGQLKAIERTVHEENLEFSRKKVDAMRRNIQKEMELEGGGHSWWYVCPECHGEIDDSDHYCRHCGQAVKRNA